MRAKRSKQYKKLVQQFQLHHGFREPYQVLVDADLVYDAQRFTMDLQASLERTLHGKVKIMITQCCIRHLYARAKEPGMSPVIDLAKTFERRRCGHRPDEFDEALSTLDCLTHVVDEKGRGENKHRYVVASQDQSVRRYMRGVAGVPLIYITRSVMIMEPMSETTAKVGAYAERAKFRSELRKTTGAKRKRADDDEGHGGSQDSSDEDSDDSGKSGRKSTGESTSKQAAEPAAKNTKKKGYGPKGPNPLSVKKKKKAEKQGAGPETATKPKGPEEGASKKKRKRKHKAAPADSAPADSAPAGDSVPAVTG